MPLLLLLSLFLLMVWLTVFALTMSVVDNDIYGDGDDDDDDDDDDVASLLLMH